MSTQEHLPQARTLFSSPSSSTNSGKSDVTMQHHRSPLQNLSSNDKKRASLDDKRTQDAVTLSYPQDVSIPTRGVVQSLYEEAMKAECEEQKRLSEAGLLSLQHVLLPAVAFEEEQAVRKLQAKTQRDHPELKTTVVFCRKAIYDSVGAAMVAVEESRKYRRENTEQEREKQWAEAREREKLLKEQEQARRRAEEEKLQELHRLKHKRELQKKLPRNQELWREHAYLMTEMTKLQKEERMWKEAEKDLKKREQELSVQEEEQKQNKEDDGADVQHDDDMMEVDEISKVEQTIEAITLSSIRIQQALKIVSGIINESEKTRKELFFRYRQDHQFHGYQGVNDPKGLLRALSQSQEVE